MSQFQEMRLGITSKIDRVITMRDRATLNPMLVRLVVALSGLAGVAVAYPPLVFTSSAAVGIGLVALMPGLFPRGPWPTLSILSIIFGYGLATGWGGVSITTWRTVVVATTIYLVHSSAAFAAVLPYDAVTSPGLFRPWLIRVAIVVGLTVLFGLFVALLPSLLTVHRMVIASVGGFGAVLVLALYLVYLWRRG
jgi:hypothetical protein